VGVGEAIENDAAHEERDRDPAVGLVLLAAEIEIPEGAWIFKFSGQPQGEEGLARCGRRVVSGPRSQIRTVISPPTVAS